MTESYTTRPTSALPYQGSQSFYKKLAKPLIALAAAAALYVGGGKAYAQNAQQPAAQEQKQEQKAPRQKLTQEIELEHIASQSYLEGKKLYESNKQAESVPHFLKARKFYNAAEKVETKDDLFAEERTSIDEWIAVAKYNRMVKDLTPEQRSELAQVIGDYEKGVVAPQPVQQPQTPAQQPTADLAMPAQAPVRKQGELYLPDGSRLYNELTIASYKSTQQRADELSLRTPFLDVYTQGHSAREKELLGDDRISEHGFGGYAEMKLLGVNAGVNYSNSTRTRKSHSSDITEDASFRITTTTDADEIVDSDYLAANGKVSFGLDDNPANQLTLGLTAHRANDNVKVDSTTLVDVFSKIGTGNYQQVIPGGDSFDVTTTGLKASVQREWELLTIGANASMARTEVGSNGSKIDVYVPVEVFMRLHAADDRWAIAGTLGRRLIDNSEEHSRWDKFHGFVNAAYHSDNGVTAFATFSQLDEPRAGYGMIIGEGNPVRMLMDYQGELSRNEIGRMEEMGPYERRAYLHALEYDFIRGLAEDNTLRLMLFGGARRNMLDGKQQWDWFAEAALAIPIITTKGNEFTLLPYFRRESNGLESILEGGVQFEPADGWRFNLKGGVIDLAGRKHERAEYLGIGIEKGF